MLKVFADLAREHDFIADVGRIGALTRVDQRAGGVHEHEEAVGGVRVAICGGGSILDEKAFVGVCGIAGRLQGLLVDHALYGDDRRAGAITAWWGKWGPVQGRIIGVSHSAVDRADGHDVADRQADARAAGAALCVGDACRPGSLHPGVVPLADCGGIREGIIPGAYIAIACHRQRKPGWPIRRWRSGRRTPPGPCWPGWRPVSRPRSAGSRRLRRACPVPPRRRPKGWWGRCSMCKAEAELRGVGAPAVKSAALLSVSVQPPPVRRTAVELVVVGAGLAPS